MIAKGTRILFTDKSGCTTPEPHTGQVGIVVASECGAYSLTFEGGQEIWARADEVTAL